MTDTKFTPGPWTIGDYGEFDGRDGLTSGISIGPAFLDGSEYCQIEGECLDLEDKAIMLSDANLISAALEMYEALSSLTVAMQARIDGTGGTNAELLEIATARVALAKARGE